MNNDLNWLYSLIGNTGVVGIFAFLVYWLTKNVPGWVDKMFLEQSHQREQWGLEQKANRDLFRLEQQAERDNCKEQMRTMASIKSADIDRLNAAIVQLGSLTDELRRGVSK